MLYTLDRVEQEQGGERRAHLKKDNKLENGDLKSLMGNLQMVKPARVLGLNSMHCSNTHCERVNPQHPTTLQHLPQCLRSHLGGI